MCTGKVIQRALVTNWILYGTYDKDLFLNTTIYEVDFPNKDVKEYAKNIITENMIKQVDSDGYSLTMIKGIINYKRDDVVAIPKTNVYVLTNQY